MLRMQSYVYLHGVTGCVLLHTTATSSEWLQSCLPSPLLVQSRSLSSVPVHCSSSRKIGPTPVPYKKIALVAMAPVIISHY